MEFLTSRAATKINCLALISLLNYFDEETIRKYFVDILKNIIPEIENYLMSKQSVGMDVFVGKI